MRFVLIHVCLSALTFLASSSEPECFSGFSFEQCCDTSTFGPSGNQACWSDSDDVPGFDDCCLPQLPASEDTCNWYSVKEDLLDGLLPGPSASREYFENWQWLPPRQQTRLYEMCCSSYDMHCWPSVSKDEYIYDMHPWYLKCCFPSLQRMLQLTSASTINQGPIAWADAAAESALGSKAMVGSSDKVKETRDQFEQQCGTSNLHRFCRFQVLPNKSVLTCNLTRDGKVNGYFESIYRALLILSFHTSLPTLDFFVSKLDVEFGTWPVPVAGQAQLAGNTITVLPHEFLLTRWNRVIMSRLDLISPPWSSRKPVLFWRGNTAADFELVVADGNVNETLLEPWITECSRCYYHMPHDWSEWNSTHWNSHNWHLHPRGRLVLLGSFAPHLIDAKFTSVAWWLPKSDQAYMERMFRQLGWITDARAEYEDHAKYRYLISTDYSDRIYWMWFSGALVFVVHSPIQHWLVPPFGANLFQEYVHYVPVKFDLSDLLEKLEWARDHEEEAAAIAANGQMLAKRVFNQEAVLFGLHRVIMKWKEAHA